MGRPVTTPGQAAPVPSSSPGAGAAPLVLLRVLGTPAPQGSKHAFAARGRGGIPTGRIGVIESGHDRVKSWRQAIVDEARSTGCRNLRISGAVLLSVAFYAARPKDHFGRGANTGVLRPGAPAYPAKAPDLSKLIRSTEDALTDAGVWGDDGQVAGITAMKHYATADELPGALITIWRL